METKYGVKGLIHSGIFISEKDIAEAKLVQHLEVKISRQNADLDQIKNQLAIEAHELGVQTVINFRYGQKKHSVLSYLNPFKWDSESWYGEGDAVKIG